MSPRPAPASLVPGLVPSFVASLVPSFVASLVPCLVLSVACASVGCGDDGDPPPPADAGTDAPRRDGGPPPMGLTYEPEGCGYEVSTPAVREVQASLEGEAVGAAPAPRALHASFAGPTSSSFAVNWRTDLDTTVTRVLYGSDEAAVAAATGPGAGVLEQRGHHLRHDTLVSGPVRLHEVHVCGLSPSTTYYYKVGGPGAWSAVYDLSTGPTIGAIEPWRLAVTGDARDESAIWAEVQARVLSHAPDLQVFSGDAVQLGFDQDGWDGFFGDSFEGTSVMDVLARVPLMPTNGNHEGLALNYVLQFALPQQLSPFERAEGEEWYSFDYANAHFVVLNDTAPEVLLEGSQREWLEADLAAVDRAATPWVFVMHHKAIYSCSTRHGSDLPLRVLWQELYDRHGVDVVFNGHDHIYERSVPIRGFQAGTTDGALAAAGPDGTPVAGSGTIYLVAAAAGAPLYGVETDCYHTHVAESVRNYVIIDFEDRTMRFAAYRLDGSVIDMFEYTK